LTVKEEKNTKITLEALLEAGAHFGHQKYRWNPKMKKYIFEERNGIYIIDLSKTIQQLRNAEKKIEEVAKSKKPILFVGTKKQARSIVENCAKECEEYYVSHRWLGGMLTNLPTIKKSVKTLERIEKKIAAGGEGLTKKEISQLTKEQGKLEKNLSGIRALRKLPSLMVVVDPKEEHIAISEANKLGIPVIALVDTNCNPDCVDYVIACNDDSLKCIKLILEFFSDIIKNKKKESKIEKKGEEE
jgi:small subunit ribosomal protein S2